MTPKSERRTALFPGSFNPFTRGHESIVRRSLAFCDSVVIAIGINIGKHDDSLSDRIDAINRVFADEPRVSVASYSGLTGEYARQIGAAFILRGVRGISDFEYELHLADVNRNLFGIETVILPTLPELGWISSSVARELSHFGYDPAELLPET